MRPPPTVLRRLRIPYEGAPTSSCLQAHAQTHTLAQTCALTCTSPRLRTARVLQALFTPRLTRARTHGHACKHARSLPISYPHPSQACGAGLSAGVPHCRRMARPSGPCSAAMPQGRKEAAGAPGARVRVVTPARAPSLRHSRALCRRAARWSPAPLPPPSSLSLLCTRRCRPPQAHSHRFVASLPCRAAQPSPPRPGLDG